MSKKVKKKPGYLPKEKENSPLGRRPVPKLPSANNFADGGQNKTLLLTTVSKSEGYFKMLSKEQDVQECDPSPKLRVNVDALSKSITGAEQRVATVNNNSAAAWHIKVFLNSKIKLGE